VVLSEGGVAPRGEENPSDTPLSASAIPVRVEHRLIETAGRLEILASR